MDIPLFCSNDINEIIENKEFEGYLKNPIPGNDVCYTI
jgi:hypothetical protein